GVTMTSLMTAGLMVAGMRYCGADGRMSLRQRRRNNTGKLGDQKEGDQKPNRARLCPEPLHDSPGCSGKRKQLWALRPRASIPWRYTVIRAKSRERTAQSRAGRFLCGAQPHPF